MGRPRDLDAKDRILTATAELVSTDGADASINAIVARAGVGKATVYRWWDSRTAVVLDAFAHRWAKEPMEVSESDDPLADLTGQLVRVARMTSGSSRPLLKELAAAMLNGEPEAVQIREAIVKTPSALIMQAVKRAVAGGALPADLDINTTVDAIQGTFWADLVRETAPTDPRQLVERTMTTVLPSPI